MGTVARYDVVLKNLIETNIRQRGDVGGSAKKVGLRIKSCSRWCVRNCLLPIKRNGGIHYLQRN